MPPIFNGFPVEEPSSTRVDMPMPIVDNPRRHGLISEYNPNLIDKIGNLVPDTGIGGVLKGLYSGTDRNLFGMLPSGNYETVSPESDLGEAISVIADPIAGAKGLRGLKHAVSGGTPVSRLIANSIKPQDYRNKLPEFMRVLTNPKALKEAVIDDIPQYVLSHDVEDRLFAWRTKLGLGMPNPIYNRPLSYKQGAGAVDYSSYKYLKENPKLGHSAEVIKRYEENLPLDRLWNKFGTHMEDGKKYYHYKNPEDYFSKIDKISGGGFHGLFGGYNKTRKLKGSKDFGGVFREGYYDNWDFAFNNSFLGSRGGFGTKFQRGLAEALLKPLEFKGTAKKIYRKPSKQSADAINTIKDYFNSLNP